MPALPSVVPAVVMVMVTHDPGPWFAETLESLATQNYPDLSLLVVDTAGEEDLTERVRAQVPLAHVHRLEDDPGFGAAANCVTDLVEGASFYAFCHDDIALQSGTIRSLVEEAFRSNAGIVGPKLVDWDDPNRILQVGMGADKTGVMAPVAERRELDQEQHDAVRDVFVVPGALTLVRADLFEALGGFDEGIDFRGEDLDLCWRSHALGARVIVAPAAKVRHRESFADRQPGERPRQRLARHRLRTVLVTYGLWHRVRVLPQAALFSMIEILYSLLTGRTERARDAAGAWTWNLRRIRTVRARRKALKSVRRVPDKEIRAFQARGSARFSALLRNRFADREDRVVDLARSSRDVAGALRAGSRQFTVAFAALLGIVFLVSSRGLVTGGVPAFGEFARFPDSPGDLLGSWASGWRRGGLGGSGAQPTAYGLLGMAGYLSFGAMGLLRSVLILATIPVGAFGAWRLARPIGSTRASIASLIVYLAIPVPYNALATGSWSGLTLYAAAPWVLLSLGRASGLAPFGPRHANPTERAASLPRRRLVPLILSLGLLLGVVAAFVPVAVALVVVMAVALGLGGVLCFRIAGVARLVAAGLGAAAVAIALNLPWAVEILRGDAPLDAVLGVGPTTGGSLGVGEILRFETGPWGAPPLGWAFLLAGALPVMIGRSWRLEWAVRAWLVVLGGWALVWAADDGLLPVALPAPEVVLAPVAAALAFTAALGLAAFEKDLRAYRLGWRQLVSVVAALGVFLGALPLLGGLLDGRWQTPVRGYTVSLDPLTDTDGSPAARTLWLGHPEVLPVGAWSYDDQTAYSATNRGRVTVLDQFSGPPPGPTDLLADALRLAEERRTTRLGHVLAPMGVRYIVAPTQLSPTNGEPEDQRPLQASLRRALAQQVDLVEVPVREGIVVYRNTAWVSERAVLPSGSGDRTVFTEAVADDLADGQPVLIDDAGAVGASGSVTAEGQLLVATAADDQWRLRIDGVPMARSEIYGWANQFNATTTGLATLSYDTPVTYRALLGGQVLVWAAVIVVRRRARRDHQPPAAPAAEPTEAAYSSEGALAVFDGEH